MRLGWRWLTLAFAFVAVGIAGPTVAFGQGPRPAARPNVVLIVLDDMGYGDLGCYGCTDIRTPNIDKLAKQGVKFTNFYANGVVCTPTRAALMTGRYQQRSGLEWAISPGEKTPGLPVEETSLPRMLKNAGYATALFGKWHLGYKPEFGPIAHGFDEFFGFLSADIDHYSHLEINGESDLYEGNQPIKKKGYMTDLITERSVSFIEKSAGRRFFLEVAYSAVHWPFQPPDSPDDVRDLKTWYKGTRADYARMLERADDGVAAIMGALERKGLTDQTLVIFTNDNGGERLSRPGPLTGYKGIVLEGGIRVPCLIRWPGRVRAGTVSPALAMTMDLTATILAATGTKPPETRKLDGVDLIPIVAGTKSPPERTLFWRVERFGQWAARKGKWKYIRHPGGELLFDLDSDAAEQRDLSKREPDVVAAIRKEMTNWESDLARSRPRFVVK